MNSNSLLKRTRLMMNSIMIVALVFSLLALPVQPASAAPDQAISTTTYAFTSSTGATLEDLSSGATNLSPANRDDQQSMVTDIGFDFWFDGVRYTQFSINTNGLMKLGTTGVTTAYTNNLATTTDNPKIAPYWDDLYSGVNGIVRYKVLGSAPARKLVVEWQNIQVPRVGAGSLGAATFQAWLYETSGVIEFVYGSGVVLTTNGYSVGIASSSTAFASVTTSGPSVSYATSDNAQTTAIASGTKYTFTPLIPAAPSGLVFSSITPNSMQLDWTDNSSDELGFAVYRSSDGGATYKFITQVGAGVTTYIANALAWCSNYTWKVIAVSEGGVSAPLIAPATTLCGPMIGVYTIDPVNPGASYPSITAALAAISGAGLNGPVTLELMPTYTPAAEVFPITINNTNTSASFPLTIRPQAGSGPLAITSANTTATLDLNGAVNVVIDGRPGGVGAPLMLTIANTAATAPAIRLINDALNNTIQYVDIRAINSSTSSGVVLFSTAGPNSLGNDDNMLTHNDIHAGATTPTNGIYALGSVPASNASNDIANSGNQVLTNNIYDFFSASTFSDGVNVAAGNTRWTINENSIYQTAARTSTAGNTHAGIYINDALGQAFTIKFNHIGGNGAGGNWQMGGTYANRFVGIQLNTVGGALTTIQSNDIRNFAWTSASGANTVPGVWCGIYARGATTPAGGAADVLDNTIGAVGSTGSVLVTTSATSPGAASYGIASIGIAGGTISGNTISSITLAGTSVSVNHGFIGIQVDFGTHIVKSNTIGDASTANSINAINASTSTTAPVQSITGIQASGVSGATISDNTVVNLNNNYAGTGAGQIRGIVTTAGSNSITGNTIYKLYTTSPQVGSGSSASLVGIAQTSTTAPQTISRNNIYTLINTASTAVALSVIGIHYAGPTSGTNVVERNFIHNMSLASTSASAYLIGINAASGLVTYRNNMVQLGLDPAGVSVSAPASMYGIYDSASATNSQFYHNTVYIDGAVGGTGTVSNSAAVYRSTSNSEDYRNNILFNARSNPAPGTGVNIAMFIGSTTGLSASTCNYNIYYATGTGGVAGRVSGTNYATLAAWQAATGFDGVSMWGNPSLNTPAGGSATADLHLVSPTPAEGSGIAIASVTDDYDGDARASYTPVDIGADAGNFTWLDLQAPAINYTTLANTALTSDRTLSATIIDASGVATGTLKPRIYYKKSAGGTWFSQAGVLASGTVINGVWDFTIVNADMGGVAVGDTIYYYVIAQDTVGNIGSNPAGVVATDVNTITTPPATPNSYQILAALSGNKTVCSTGCDFDSLTNANGLFATINASIVTGNITAKIQSDLTAETGLNALNQWVEEGGSGFTLTIQPDGGAARLVSGSNSSVLIDLNGADRVTFDGLNSGGNTLTIANTGTGNVLRLINAATNNTIRNATLQGVGTTGGVISISTSTAATGNDNNTIQNNTITSGATSPLNGIYVLGTSGKNNDQNTIRGNTITNFSQAGVYIDNYASNTLITGNTIYEAATQTTAALSGIYVNYAPGTTTITRNSIYGLATSGATPTLRGIYYYNGSSGDVLNVYNNMIALDTTTTHTTATIYGIDNWGNSGTTLNLYHNSIHIGGSGVTSGNSAGLYDHATHTVNLKNNIFLNSRSNGAGTGKHYGIWLSSSSYLAGLTSDYNDILSTGTGGYFGSDGTDRATLAAWQTATSKDANSISADPMFVSTSDLHISATSATPIEGRGVNIPTVTDDYDGQTRASLTPVDIGADAGDFLISVTFVYHDLEDVVYSGEQVALAGDFNTWSTTANIMTGDAGATTFTTTLTMNPGSSFQYKYVVKSGGDQWDWLQTNNRSQTVNSSTTLHDYRNVVVGWANLQWPTSLTILLGQNTGNIYGRVFVNNVTNPSGQGRGVKAELGYGADANPANWTWSAMSYNVDDANNDEYMGVITPTLSGVYSYTARFDGNWGVGNPNGGWTYGDKNGTPPFSIHDVGVLTVNPPVYYTLTMNTVGSGSVSPAVGNHSYLKDTVVPVSATADPGWTFAGWSGDLSGSTNPTSITMTADKEVTATFTQDEYTLTINVVGGGSVSKNPDQTTYHYGDVVTVTTTANTGWTFSGWSGDLSGSTNPTTITMNGNRTITATFTQIEYTLAVNLVGNGSVGKNPNQATYHYGDVVTVTATADPGWVFSGWSGDLGGSTNPTSITIDSNKTITATFTQTTVTLTVNISGSGSVGKNPDQAAYGVGEVVTLTATADPGWTFAGWSGDLNGSTNPTSITMDSNKTVTATFTQNEYTLTVNVVGNGAVGKNPDQTIYYYGDLITVTATADPGWNFTSWSGDLSGSDNPDTITIDGNKTITATFTQGEYSLTVNIIGNGSVGKNPDQTTYVYGDVVTLTAAADTGWTFAGWSGDLSGSENPKAITITGNQTVTATFTQNTYNLTVNVVGGGSVSKTPNQASYTYGEVVTLTATANPGWVFAGWSGDLGGSENPKAITMDGNKTVTATFTRIEYTLTVNIVGSGSVIKNPNKATYYYGDVVQLTASASPGWKFTGWSGDVSGLTNTVYITINGNKSVTATFTQIEYTLTVNIVGGGSVTKTPDQASYHYGDVVQLTAAADPAWKFSGWSGDLGGSSTPINIVINGDKTITATFIQYRNYMPLIINDAAPLAVILPAEKDEPDASLGWTSFLFLVGIAFQKFYGRFL